MSHIYYIQIIRGQVQKEEYLLLHGGCMLVLFERRSKKNFLKIGTGWLLEAFMLALIPSQAKLKSFIKMVYKEGNARGAWSYPGM